jgi:hypothetical protein
MIASLEKGSYIETVQPPADTDPLATMVDQHPRRLCILAALTADAALVGSLDLLGGVFCRGKV